MYSGRTGLILAGILVAIATGAYLFPIGQKHHESANSTSDPAFQVEHDDAPEAPIEQLPSSSRPAPAVGQSGTIAQNSNANSSADPPETSNGTLRNALQDQQRIEGAQNNDAEIKDQASALKKAVQQFAIDTTYDGYLAIKAAGIHFADPRDFPETDSSGLDKTEITKTRDSGRFAEAVTCSGFSCAEIGFVNIKGIDWRFGLRAEIHDPDFQREAGDPDMCLQGQRVNSCICVFNVGVPQYNVPCADITGADSQKVHDDLVGLLENELASELKQRH